MTGLTFNLLLRQAGIDPAQVRLLRHQARGHDGSTPYSLLRGDRSAFEAYQAVQLVSMRPRLLSPFWAAFVVGHDGRSIFAGLYARSGTEAVPEAWLYPLGPPSSEPEELHHLELISALADYAGRLAIEWGPRTRSWAQRADLQDKAILELKASAIDPPFPGFGSFMAPLSAIASLPPAWTSALAAERGIYLLTCPQTGELYVGSASGADGFMGRWRTYVANGHGGNIGLLQRDPSDYRVAVLETVGTLASEADILQREALWKVKLMTRDVGLNRN